MFCPGLEVFVHNGAYPVFIAGHGNLTVIWSDCWRYTAEECEGIVVDADPVFYVALSHTLRIEVIAVGKCGNKDGNFCCLFRIMTVMNAKHFSCKVQFEIDTRISLDMEGKLFGIRPFTVSSAILAVAHRSFAVHNARSIVFLPEMFKCLTLTGKCLIDGFCIEIPIQKLVSCHTRLFLQQFFNVLICDILRQRIR